MEDIGTKALSGTPWPKDIGIGTIASSDHWSTHLSYAMVFTETPTRLAIFEAIKRRHTYGATDNIVLDYRLGEYFMGDEFTASQVPPLEIYVLGTSPVSRIEIIKNEKVVYTATPGKKEVKLSYLDQDAGSRHKLLLCAANPGRRPRRLGKSHLGDPPALIK